MKIFIDTANIDQIKQAMAWGVIDGVTTNPSLIKREVDTLVEQNEDVDIEGYIKQILATAGRLCSVSLEVPGLTADDMIAQGKYLYELFNSVAGNVAIKIPICTISTQGAGDRFDGLRAITALSEEHHIPVNATLIFTPEQALLAAKAGAEYVSPFAGRVDDRIRREVGFTFDKTDYFPADGVNQVENQDTIATDHGLVSGVDLIARIADIFSIFELESQIIAASIRNPIQVREVAEAGAHIATVPFKVLNQMVEHPGTAAGIDSFCNDLVDEYLAIFKNMETER